MKIILLLSIIYLIGTFFAYKGVKKTLSNNGNEPWTKGKMYFAILYSCLSWVGALAMADWFVEWAEKQNKESKF
jgi:hypothetical protein